MTTCCHGLLRCIGRSVIGAALLVATSFAQSPNSAAPGEPPIAMSEGPCPPTLEVPPGARDLLIELFIQPRTLAASDFERLTNNAEFKHFNEASRLRGPTDWAGRCRFQLANANALAAPIPPRVVFMGDSITENWGLADQAFFDHGTLNRGISGQTSEQMLVRFRSDVVALRPRIVLILAGTNDIAGNTGRPARRTSRTTLCR